MRIVGPNCIGMVNTVRDCIITFMTLTPPPKIGHRKIGLISQSGALGFSLAQASARGVSFSHAFTSGNSCDIDMSDFVSYLADDPACGTIACVFEGSSNPERLLEAAEIAWAGQQAADRVQDRQGRAGCRGGDVAHRLARRYARDLPIGAEAYRRDHGRELRGSDRHRRVLRQGRRAERPGRRGAGELGRGGDHGGGLRRGARRAAAAAAGRLKTLLESHIPDFGVSQQSGGRDRAGHQPAGIAQRLRHRAAGA